MRAWPALSAKKRGAEMQWGRSRGPVVTSETAHQACGASTAMFGKNK